MSQPTESDPYFAAPSFEDQQRTSGWAIASIVFGIAGFCLWILTSIPAIIFGVIGLAQINKSGGRIGGQGLAVTGIVTGALGTVIGVPLIMILVALMLPALSAVKSSAQQSLSTANMKQISLATLTSQEKNRSLPQVADSSQGAPVSWRVQITPFLEAPNIYDQYRWDQPWDSEDNLLWSEELMPIFMNPSVNDWPDGFTNYLVLAGDETAFPPTEKVTNLEASSTTILFVEANDDRAIPWTQPKDIDYNAHDPLNGVGQFRPGGFLVTFGDTRTQMVTGDVDPDVFRAMATRSADDNGAIGDFFSQ